MRMVAYKVSAVTNKKYIHQPSKITKNLIFPGKSRKNRLSHEEQPSG